MEAQITPHTKREILISNQNWKDGYARGKQEGYKTGYETARKEMQAANDHVKLTAKADAIQALSLGVESLARTVLSLDKN